MNLLIYGLNYAPELTGTGKYTGETAACLAARGHEVEVICGLPHYPQWKLDAAYAGGRSRAERLNGVWVRRASHFVPTADALGARARIRLVTSALRCHTSAGAVRWGAALREIFIRRVFGGTALLVPPYLGLWLCRVGQAKRTHRCAA